MADFRESKLENRKSKNENRNSEQAPLPRIGNEFRFSNFEFPLPPSAIMSVSELGTSYPKIGHRSRDFRPPLLLTPRK